MFTTLLLAGRGGEAQAAANRTRRVSPSAHRHSIADVIGSFLPVPHARRQTGLRGEYFNARNFRGGSRLIDRTDPAVDFDFGTTGPEVAADAKTKFDSHQFSIRWEGSVIAPETGLYEFVVRSDHAARLWVNEPPRAHRSLREVGFRDRVPGASIFLLAGRGYPLKLEFSKAKQGVNDAKKNPNPPPKPAFISLSWKRPNRTDEVIADRYLTPAVPRGRGDRYALPTRRPQFRWERGTTVSREWDAATTVAAIEAAAHVGRLNDLAGVREGDKDRPAKLREFGARFAERAFRRPLSGDERALYIDRQFDSTPDADLALKPHRPVRPQVAASSSPRPRARRASTRSSRSPSSSGIPPGRRVTLRRRGRQTRHQGGSREHAERMLADPRARGQAPRVPPDVAQGRSAEGPGQRRAGSPTSTPPSPTTCARPWSSSSMTCSGAIRPTSGNSSSRMRSTQRLAGALLRRLPAQGRRRTGPFGWIGPRAKEEPDAPFTKMKFEPDRRAGALTHPYLLASLAYTSELADPSRRLCRPGLLGIPIRPPVDAFTPLPADLHPNLTTRASGRPTDQARRPARHSVMNPLGYALEHFDAVGRYREKDGAKPVDSTGNYETRNGETAKFAGARTGIPGRKSRGPCRLRDTDVSPSGQAIGPAYAA